MPLYIYEPEGGGAEVERFYHGNPPELVRIGGATYRRTPVTRMAIVGLKPAPVLGDEIIGGYYDQECRQGSRFRTRLPADRIKEVWAGDTVTADEKAADAGDQNASQRLSASGTP